MLSYRKLAMRVLGRPLHTGGGIGSTRPASQRAAAFALTAAMLITLTAPAFAGTWYIENGDITVKASGTEGKNTVSQGDKKDVEDTNTIITNQNKDKASSHTVTIEAEDHKVEVTLDNVNIETGSGSALTSKGDVTLTLKGDNHLTGGISGNGYGGSGIASTGSLTISGGETDSLTAQGGSGENGGDGISSKDLTISGGTVTATGGNSTGIVGSGGSGIHSGGDVTISGGTVTATGGDSTGSDGSGGYGIYSSSTTTISGGTVTATGGDSTGSYSSGGYGIYSSGVTISGGSTVTANGGNGGSLVGGDGIRSGGGQTECLAKFDKDPRVYQTTVKEFLKDDAGNLTGAVISYLKPQRDPDTGRTSMVPTGEEFTYDCQLAFIAAGFVGCEDYVAEAFGVERNARGNVADHGFRTNVDKVFVCGDMRRGQSLVVWGLREGRDCAAEVDRYLMGYTNL